MHQNMTLWSRQWTELSSARGNVVNRGGIDIAAPPCIRDYNRHMGGVDFADRIIKYYNCARRSCKWTRRIFFHLLELAIHNAYVLESYYRNHRSATNRLVWKHQEFREELADQLVAGYRVGSNRPSDAYASSLSQCWASPHIQ